MRDWETDWDRGALERIVALLFSLAGLADLTAGASFLRRRRVLGIVSYGEAEARAFVIGMACGEDVPPDALETSRDAGLLAVRLRALALMLCLMLAQAAPFRLPGTVGPGGRRRSHKISGAVARRLDASTPPAADTS